MKIVKITYQKAFVIGPYLQERIGLEAELGEDQSSHAEVQNALRILQLEAETFHSSFLKCPPTAINQQGDEYQRTPPPQPPEPPTEINLNDERISIAIENAKTLEELTAVKNAYPVMKVPLLAALNERIKNI